MKFQEAINIINEERDLEDGKTGLLVLDIDDTLIRANPNVIKCYKSVNGKEQPLTTAQFATDPDKKAMGKNVRMYNRTEDAPKDGIAFSIREFRDPQKVYESITKGTPLMRNLKLLDSHINAGWDMCFLTARGLQKVVTQALGDTLKTRNRNGQLVDLGERFKRGLSAAVNDEEIKYLGADDGEKKGNILRQLCGKYDKVKFVDDDARNLNAAKRLGLKNLIVVKANRM